MGGVEIMEKGFYYPSRGYWQAPNEPPQKMPQAGGWPAAFDTFLAGLTTQQRIAAKAAWVDGDRVRRNDPILALIAADQGITDTQIDDLFRSAMEIEA